MDSICVTSGVLRVILPPVVHATVAPPLVMDVGVTPGVKGNPLMVLTKSWGVLTYPVAAVVKVLTRRSGLRGVPGTSIHLRAFPASLPRTWPAVPVVVLIVI